MACYGGYLKFKAGEFKWSDGEYGIKMLVPATLDEKYRLAALYIPKNAIVYVPTFTPITTDDFMKRRASKAYVIEICAVTRENCSFVRDPAAGIVLHRANYGESMYRGKFNRDKIVYTAGKYVEPTERFSLKDQPCDSGIHYFESVRDMGESYLKETLYAAVDVTSTNITLTSWFMACIDKHKELLKKAHCGGNCGTCEWQSTHISKEPCRSCKYDLDIHGFTNYERRRDLDNE